MTIEDKYIFIGGGIASFLILVLFGLVIYLLVRVHKLRKQTSKENNDDGDSFDDESDIQQPPALPPQNFNGQPQYQQNPYNPVETFTIKRAKLMVSLRNKISKSPRNVSVADNNEFAQPNYPPNDYIQPIADLAANLPEDDYPYPKNGTLKNEILNARFRMSKKPQAPAEWRNEYGHPRAAEPRTPSDIGHPPRDYPAFPGSRPASSQQGFTKKYNAPQPRNNRGLTQQENDAMAMYDQTIANQERGYMNNGYPSNPGFLHNKYSK